jgi:hypothetical protein
MKKVNSVLKAIREVRRQHYQETKHMTMQERMEHDQQRYEDVMAEHSKMNVNDGQYTFPFLRKQKEAQSLGDIIDNNEVIKAIREVRKQRYQKTK